MKKKIILTAAALAAFAYAAHAVNFFTGTLINETALAHNNTYVLDLAVPNIVSVSANANYSPASVPTASFQDGRTSSGTVSVLNFANLNQRAATDNLTVVNNSALKQAVIQLPGYWFLEGLDWKAQSTATGTALSIAAALNRTTLVTAHASGNVVYATAVANGTYYNSISLRSSTPTALSVASSFLTGGLDNAVLKVNGTMFRAGRDFTAATSNNATASSIAAAINANAQTKKWVRATPSGANVSLAANFNGSIYNFSTFSSDNADLALNGPVIVFPNGSAASNMTNGVAPDVALGSAKINIPGHHLTSALAVLYTQGALLGGLTDQTTYYAIPVDANTVELASSANNATASPPVAIVITSTNTGSSANSYSLAPLPFSGIAGFDWEVSNDKSSWSPLSVSSVTVHAGDSPAITSWAFGTIGLRFLRANVVAPTTGGLQVMVTVAGN